MSALSGITARTLQISSPAIPLVLGHLALEPFRISGPASLSSLFTDELLQDYSRGPRLADLRKCQTATAAERK